MQKAIHIDDTGNKIERVLSIADPIVMEANPTGLPYVLIEDYENPPEVKDPALDINYPMYDTEAKKFFWITVNYTLTATDHTFEMQNLRKEIEVLQQEKNDLQEVVDVLLLKSLMSDEESEVVENV